LRSTSECLTKAVSRWSKNGTVVSMSAAPDPSRSIARSMLDSEVSRWSSAVRWVVMILSLLTRQLGHRRQEVSGLALGARGDPEVVRDPDVADQDVALEQGLEDRVRVLDPSEEDEVGPARPHRVAQPGQFGQEAVTLPTDVLHRRE